MPATRFVLAAVLLLSTAASGSAGTGGRYPIFNVAAFSHELGTTDALMFSFRSLQYAPAPAVLSIVVPKEYRLAAFDSLDASNELVIVAKNGQGARTTYTGTLGNAVKNTSVDSSSTACTSRKHAFVWRPTVDSEDKAKHLLIPVAFDRHGTYSQLLLCLDALKAQGLHPVELIVSLRFHQPSRSGVYTFSGLVAPFTAAGETDATRYYEMRAAEVLPLRMTVSATYSMATKMLKVSGRVVIKAKPWGGEDVLLTAQGATVTDLGDALTRPDGTFSLTKKLGSAPSRVGAYIPSPEASGCSVQKTSAPAGCRSESVDGIQKNDVGVVVTK